ncbi:hypothetical protein L1887_60025 [Cichorium endivia]|nr:hypothetical protein L1887_60025 [Cichorium endivia]
MDLKRVPVSVESGHEEPKRVERGRGRGRRMDDAGGKDARTREEEKGWGGRPHEFRDLSQRPSSTFCPPAPVTSALPSAIQDSSLRPPTFWAAGIAEFRRITHSEWISPTHAPTCLHAAECPPPNNKMNFLFPPFFFCVSKSPALSPTEAL